MSPQPKVVIVGAGFAGLEAAKALADQAVDITLVDRRNHHTFQPLLYQVATAGLNPSDIAQPIRQIIGSQANCRVLLAEATEVDLAGQQLVTTNGPIGYDYLILACGATHAYFGNDHWAELAPGLKTIEDALDIRRRILLAFEQAEAAASVGAEPIVGRRHMTFVVVGAGPTGVELAGAIQEIATQTLRGQFRSIDTGSSRVVLVEAGPRVLPGFVESLSKSASDQLARLGVEVMVGTRVEGIDGEGVETSAGRIEASTVLWAAGVSASPLGQTVSTQTDRAGRVPVTTGLTLAGVDGIEHHNIFVVGDMAAAVDSDGVSVPGVAPAAQQGGLHAAACIEADLAGRPRPRFRYKDKGSMATIGRSAAVVDLGRVQFSGYPAWVVWWLVHIWSLIGFRSRATVMVGWAWQYLTRRRDARLITDVQP